MSKLNTCRHNNANELDNFDWAIVCKWAEEHQLPSWIDRIAQTVDQRDCSTCKCYEKRD